MSTSVLFLGADHNGYRLKQQLKRWLESEKVAVQDVGAPRLISRDDYPLYAAAVAKKVAAGKGMGILLCGSGHGMAISANRFRGVRAALCTTPFSARMAKHDDFANVLVLAAREVGFAQAKKIIQTWLQTPPSRVPRHRRRIVMLERR